MTDPFLIAGVILGVTLSIIYLFTSWIGNNLKAELGGAVAIFLASMGVLLGVKVCFLAFDSSMFNGLETEAVCIFIGGGAVIWISVTNIADRLTPSKN